MKALCPSSSGSDLQVKTKLANLHLLYRKFFFLLIRFMIFLKILRYKTVFETIKLRCHKDPAQNIRISLSKGQQGGDYEQNFTT